MESRLNAVVMAFADTPRPEHFTNYEHCDECAEYDVLFGSRTVETLTPDDMGRSGLWDPVCFLSEQGFFYYLPVLARFACEQGGRYCLDNLLFHLNADRIAAMSRAQREAVRQFIAELGEQLGDQIEANLDREDLTACLSRLAV